MKTFFHVFFTSYGHGEFRGQGVGRGRGWRYWTTLWTAEYAASNILIKRLDTVARVADPHLLSCESGNRIQKMTLWIRLLGG